MVNNRTNILQTDMICKKRLWIVFPKSFVFYGCCFAKNIGDDICFYKQ